MPPIPPLNLSLSDSSKQLSGLGDLTQGGLSLGNISLRNNQSPYLVPALILGLAVVLYKVL